MSATELEVDPAPGVSRRRLLLIPVALLGIIALALAYLFLTARPEPGVPLGASASIPGGMASIGEIMPVEDDGWEPDDNDDALDGAPAARQPPGAAPGPDHGAGARRRAAGCPGLQHLRPWRRTLPANLGIDRRVADLEQGESVGATLIFEVPDRAVALVLDGPGNSRLSLGLSHHTG